MHESRNCDTHLCHIRRGEGRAETQSDKYHFNPFSNSDEAVAAPVAAAAAEDLLSLAVRRLQIRTFSHVFGRFPTLSVVLERFFDKIAETVDCRN